MLIFASPKIVQTVFEQLGTKFHLTREMCFLGMDLDNNKFDAKKVAEQKSESDDDSSESFEGSEEED